MNKRIVYFFYVLLTIWSLSSISNSLYRIDADNPQGILHIITVICQLSIEAIALYHVLFARIGINKTGRLIIVWFSYALIISLLFPREFLTDIRTILWWPSVYLLFFYIAKTDNSELLSVFIKLFLPIIFLGNSIVFLSIKASIVFLFDYFKASNDIYYVVTLLPILTLIGKKRLKYTFFAICIFLSLYSFKRGAQLSVLFALVLFILTEMKSQKRSPLRIGFLLAFVIGGTYLAVTYVNKKTEGFVFERFNDIEESGGSGRENIYSQVIQKYASSPINEQLIGIGMGGVKNKFQITNAQDGRSYSAHNDFLEMLVDYGIIGFVIYLRIIIGFISEMIRSRRLRLGAMYQMSLMTLAVFLTMSMVSHLFLYPSYVSFLMISFGVVAGTNSRVLNNKL